MQRTIVFPDPARANEEGLLAYGGDLSVATLVSAYAQGVFPWFGEEDPILWWTPDPRMVLMFEDHYVSRRFRRTLRTTELTVRLDTAFERVINLCAAVSRPGQESTWIIPDMIEAYIALHEAGFAHSVEVFNGTRLVGGIYGVSLGRAFFGESMFHLQTDASKIALFYLVETLKALDFHFLDAQQVTPHMLRMGGRPIARADFLARLEGALEFDTLRGNWGEYLVKREDHT